MIMFCKNCGNKLKTDEKFCSECGNKRAVAPTSKCSNCGFEPEGEALKFCPQCGTKF